MLSIDTVGTNYKLIYIDMRKKLFTKLFTALTLILLVGLSACNTEDISYDTPELQLSGKELGFDATGAALGADASFKIETNRSWTISVPDKDKSWIRLSQESGKGTQLINVTILPNEGEDRESQVKVSSSINYEYIIIKQEGLVSAEAIYSEKVGTDVEKVDTRWPYADQFEGWSREGTLDQSAVVYGGSGANVSNSGKVFQPADGSSITGAPYVGLNASGGNVRTFTISKINVSESTNLKLRFASLFQSDYSNAPEFGEITNESFAISGSLDGNTWTAVTTTVEKDPAGGDWYILTSEFQVPEGTRELNLKFEATPQNNQGYRLDDFKVIRGGEGTIVIGEGGTIPEPTGTILSESMGNVETANIAVNEFTGWLRGGSGAANVKYVGTPKTDVRKSTASSGYDGATGGNSIFFGKEDNGTFEINDINVSGKTQLTFSFGISWQVYPGFGKVDNNTIKLSASIDGTNYTPLTFTNASTEGWVLATSEFKVPAGTSKLHIKFAEPTVQSAIRLDDFKLVEGGNGQTEIGGGTTPEPTAKLLYENMGNEESANTQVDAFTGWLRSGDSATGVTYTGSAKTDVRKSTASNGYEGASGGNNIFFGKEDNGMFEINDINVSGKRQLTFSFGISWQANYPAFAPIDNNTITLTASIDGISYTPLTFTNASTAGWVLATSEFKVPAGAEKLHIMFMNPAAQSQVRLDDFTLVEGGNGQTEIGGGATTPELSFGVPAISGTMTAGAALSGVKLTIPYDNAKAEKFTVDVTASGAGAAGINAITAKAVTLETGKGNLVLDITGTPTTAGDVTFTIGGLTGLATTTVNATVQSGGGSAGGDFSALWDMTGVQWGDDTMNPTSTTGSDITVGALTKHGFTSSGASGGNNWGGNDFSENTEDIMLTAPVKYASITVTSGKTFSLESLEATIRITKTGPIKTSVQYSIDGGAYAEAKSIEFERPSATKTFPKETVDLSGVAALQNISAGKTLTIRLVPVATEGTTTGNWYLNGTDALSVKGSTK